MLKSATDMLHSVVTSNMVGLLPVFFSEYDLSSEFFAMRGKSPTGANGCFWKRGIVPVTGLIGTW